MLNAALKIGQIGDILDDSGAVESIHYFSNRNFSDFDILLVKVSKLYKELTENFKLAHSLEYARIDAFLDMTKTEFREFLNHGGLVLLFLDQIPMEKPVEPVTAFQLRNENEFSLLMLNSDDFDFHTKVGNEFGQLGDLEGLQAYFKFQYRFLWDQVAGTPLFKPKKGKGYAGFKSKVGKGWIYGLPQATRRPFVDGGTLSAIKTLREGIYNDISLQIPGWVERFLVGDEEKYAVLKKKLEKEQKLLQEKILENEQQLEQFLEIKRLIFTGDTALEQVVEDVFRRIGFNVSVPEGNNDDLNIVEKDFTAVVEIKGITKSAATSHAAQLEKWVSSYFADNHVEAKGILIVNAFKDLAPKDRKENAFPPDLVKFSTKKEHCLMVTLDLLNLYVDFENGLVTKEEIKVLLSTTVGILSYEPRFQSGQEK